MTKKLNLVYDFNAVLALEQEGIELLNGGLKEDALRKMSNFKKLVWAGLLHVHPELTVEASLTYTKGLNPKEVISLVTDALNESLKDTSEVPPASS